MYPRGKLNPSIDRPQHKIFLVPKTLPRKVLYPHMQVVNTRGIFKPDTWSCMTHVRLSQPPRKAACTVKSLSDTSSDSCSLRHVLISLLLWLITWPWKLEIYHKSPPCKSLCLNFLTGFKVQMINSSVGVLLSVTTGELLIFQKELQWLTPDDNFVMGKARKIVWLSLLTPAIKMPFSNSSNQGFKPSGQLANKIKVSGSSAQVSTNKCPNKALIQNANISSLFSMWNSHWCKWKYHVWRQCKRYLQRGSREGILPAVLRNLNHSPSPRTPGCRKKKKKSCTYSVWESHHPPSQNLLNWNRAVFSIAKLKKWRNLMGFARWQRMRSIK